MAREGKAAAGSCMGGCKSVAAESMNFIFIIIISFIYLFILWPSVDVLVAIGEASALDANESLLFLLLKVVERSEAFFFFFLFFVFPQIFQHFAAFMGWLMAERRSTAAPARLP